MPATELAKRNQTILGSISDWINTIVRLFTVVLMVSLIVVMGLEVVYRYVLNDSLAWSQEVAGFLFLWIILLGATIGVKEGRNPSFGSLVHVLSGKIKASVILLGRCFILGYLVDVFALTIKLLPSNMIIRSAALQLPLSYVYIVFLIFAAVASLHVVTFVIQDWREIPVLGWLISVVGFTAIVYMGLTTQTQHMHLNFPIVLLVSILTLIVLGVPIAFVIGIVSIFLLYFSVNFPMDILPQRMYLVNENFSLMAIPFFMVTGALMQVGSVADRLVQFAASLFGWVRGGFGYVDILVSAFFADISGSAVADTAAIGSVLLPGMIKKGYEKKFATALQAANGTLGVMIPPSITTILYSITANVSVTEMFYASFLPALLVMVSFAVVNYFVARRREYPSYPRPSGGEVWNTFKRAFFPLWTPFIILGGILSGVFTPTEAGVIAVLYTMVMMLFQRELNWKSLYTALTEGIHGTSRVLLILASTLVLGWLLVVSQLSQTIATGMFSMSHNKIIILIIVNVFLALVHVLLESSATILLIVPILMPLVSQVGIDPIHFGILLLINSAIGLLTPPLGVILYIASGITNIKVEQLSKAVIPFICALVADLLIVLIFPGFVSFVPNLFMH